MSNVNNKRLSALIAAISALTVADLDAFSDDQISNIRSIKRTAKYHMEEQEREERYKREREEEERRRKAEQDRYESNMRALREGGLTESEIADCKPGGKGKIHAIKSVRERTNCGLADAKNFVERECARLGISFPTSSYA